MIHPYLLPPLFQITYLHAHPAHTLSKNIPTSPTCIVKEKEENARTLLFLSNTLNELLQLKVIGNGPHLIIHSINGVKPRTFSGIFSRFTQLRIRSIGAEVNTGCNNLP